MAEPTCRVCYALTLTPDERDRFYSEPVTSCVSLCPEHERVDQEIRDTTARLLSGAFVLAAPPPPFAPVVSSRDTGETEGELHDLDDVAREFGVDLTEEDE